MNALRFLAAAAALSLVTTATGQDTDKKPRTDGVIVLIDAKTDGVAEGVAIKQVEVPKDSDGKRTVSDAKAKGKDQPRVNGEYVAKKGTITLADGKVLEGREVMVAIEVGKQTLKDFKYVETVTGRGEKGPGKWYAYTAEYDMRE